MRRIFVQFTACKDYPYYVPEGGMFADYCSQNNAQTIEEPNGIAPFCHLPEVSDINQGGDVGLSLRVAALESDKRELVRRVKTIREVIELSEWNSNLRQVLLDALEGTR